MMCFRVGSQIGAAAVLYFIFEGISILRTTKVVILKNTVIVFPQIPADFSADLRRICLICEKICGNLRESAGKSNL